MELRIVLIILVCNGSYKGNMDADDVCAICYDKLFRNDEDDVVVQLKKCCHAFHRSCLEVTLLFLFDINVDEGPFFIMIYFLIIMLCNLRRSH